MAKYTYKLTETAKEDIEQISQYIADNYYAETALSVLREIRVKIEKICQAPSIYEEKEIMSVRFGHIRIAT